MSFSLGTDPEFFIFDKKTGKPVPAHRFFKDKTSKIPLGGGPSTAFRDGYAVEINVLPQYCRENLASAVFGALRNLRDVLGDKYEIKALSAVPIDRADLEGAPPDVLEFGCDPSWNAYTGMPSSPTISAAEHPYRYAGGHLHLGYNQPSEAKIAEHGRCCGLHRLEWYGVPDDVALYVKMVDLFVGIPLSFLLDSPEQYLRRQYYGKAGEFRFQTYNKGPDNEQVGIEYRTLGPEIWRHPATASLALGVMRQLANTFLEAKGQWDKSVEPAVREAINTGKGLAELVRELSPWYNPKLLAAIAKRAPFADWYPFGRNYSDSSLGWYNWLDQWHKGAV